MVCWFLSATSTILLLFSISRLTWNYDSYCQNRMTFKQPNFLCVLTLWILSEDKCYVLRPKKYMAMMSVATSNEVLYFNRIQWTIEMQEKMKKKFRNLPRLLVLRSFLFQQLMLLFSGV